ncbi:mariner transposase [Trichonephila clavipes]|nr:mariner transposase [Trichonephila clavipes]
MASVFWDAIGIIFINYLEKGKTINDEYCANLLQRVSGEIEQKRPHLAKKKVFNQDNAPTPNINKLKFELLPHAPYSPDLAPSIIFYSQTLKDGSVVRFSNDEEVMSAVMAI